MILLATLLSSALALADTRIRCEAPKGTEIGERGGIELSILDSGKASGSSFGMMWNGFLGRSIEFRFETPEFKLLKESDLTRGQVVYSSGEIHSNPPRYVTKDQKLDIDQRSVSVILFSFPKTATIPRRFNAELLYYQRYFLHDLFVDGGQQFRLDCQADSGK